MSHSHTKEILLLYRPGRDDEQDPEMADALELARRDPELSAWFAEHCAAQEALRAKFRQLPVPEGLKEQILSERKAHFALPTGRKLALAGAFVALVVAATWAVHFFGTPSKESTFAAFRARMTGTVLRLYPKMDLETNDLNQIRRFLVDHHAHGDYKLPQGLEKAASTGCALLTWHDQRVSMICFNSGRKATPTGNSDIFLFVVDRKVVTNPPPPGATEFGQIKQLAMASWCAGDKAYVLAGFGDEAFIRKYCVD